MPYGNPDDPAAQLLALHYSAQQKLILAARAEYEDKFGRSPDEVPPVDDIPDGYVPVGNFANTVVIKRTRDRLDDSTVVWPWPYFDPKWAGGMILSELRAMFPFVSF